jgi:hypothetical protein
MDLRVKAEVQVSELLPKWFELSKLLARVKKEEMELRKQIFKEAFPDPKEGTNNHNLPDNYVLKGKYSLNRSIDQGAFDAIKEKLREMNVNPDTLVRYKPELALSVYKALKDDEKALFEQCLTIKPGSPSLEIVLPKKAAKK